MHGEMSNACRKAAAIVLALHDARQMNPETAAGLAHFYAATTACSTPKEKTSSVAPPFDGWIRDILLRGPDIDADRWLSAHPIQGVRGHGAKLFFEPIGCPQKHLTLLSSTDKTVTEPNGDVADKVVCEADATLSAAPCRVLSVGSDGDAAFENEVHRRWPRCAIDVFDGTLTGSREFLRKKLPSYINFVPRNFGPMSWQSYNGQTVAILKIDCERCEHEALIPWLTHVCTQQILIEVHPPGQDADDANRTAHLLAAISETHEPFFGVHNHRAGKRKGGRFAELAWRRRKPCVD